MIRFLRLSIFLVSALLLLSPALPRLAPGQAVFYKYVDKNGNAHFTDRLESVPEEYRNQIKEYKGESKPETISPPAQMEAGERAEKIRDAAAREKEAEARAPQEKAAQEEKLKAREAKEKRIAEMQAQIRAKQQEQRNLRTTWMVYDRAKLNQLNQDIANLEKEIESLRREMAEDK